MNKINNNKDLILIVEYNQIYNQISTKIYNKNKIYNLIYNYNNKNNNKQTIMKNNPTIII